MTHFQQLTKSRLCIAGFFCGIQRSQVVISEATVGSHFGPPGSLISKPSDWRVDTARPDQATGLIRYTIPRLPSFAEVTLSPSFLRKALEITALAVCDNHCVAAVISANVAPSGA